MGRAINFKIRLLLLIIILAISWFLFTYKLEEVPPGINGDEAIIGLNAAEIAKTGYDLEGRFLPLFTKAVGSTDWKQPITLYSTSLMFKIFGVSYFNLRVVSVVFVLTSIFITFILIEELINIKIAILGSLILITTPILVIQSHLALENIAPLPFILFWLLMLIKYTKQKRLVFLFLGGFSLGFSIFSYLGMRLVTPVLAIISCIYIFYLNRDLFKIKWFIIGLLPILILLLISKIYYPGAILGSYRPYIIENYQNFFLPYLSSFDPSFLYIFGDSTPYHSTGRGGMFLLASLPIFVLGIINILKKKNKFYNLVLISFFLAPLFFGIGSTPHRASRLLALLPLYTIISTIGFLLIFELRKKITKWIFLVLILFLIIINFSDFTQDFWYQYPQRVRLDFEKPVQNLYKELSKTSKINNLKPLIQHNISNQNFDFFGKVYFPQGLQKWSQSETIPQRSIILIDLPGISSKNKDKLNIVRWGESDYYFLINKEDHEI